MQDKMGKSFLLMKNGWQLKEILSKINNSKFNILRKKDKMILIQLNKKKIFHQICN